MNKTIFITGASGGVGGAIARLFQSNGWNIHVFLRSLGKKETQELMHLSNVFAHESNPENKDEMVSTFQTLLQRGIIPSIVFHSAGTFMWDDGYPGSQIPLDEVKDILFRSNVQTKISTVEALREVYFDHLLDIEQFFVGSHAANFALDGPERTGKYTEEAYVEAMQKVAQYGKALIEEKQWGDITVLEPGLIDTHMARKAFTLERIGREPDWSHAPSPETYADSIFPRIFFESRN